MSYLIKLAAQFVAELEYQRTIRNDRLRERRAPKKTKKPNPGLKI